MAKSIVDIAVEDGRFTTLVAALQAADLAETLAGEGPFTVFAPTDDAFAALPEGTVEALLEDIPQLTDILLYHVVAGQVMASDVVELDQAPSLQGQFLSIATEDGMVRIDDSEVLITDIEGSNGVIHVIDSVLLPESRSIVDIAVEDGRFTTLVAALQAAGLDSVLAGEGPFTVFAPTDDAFAALPEGTVEALLADIPQLTDILLYHVVDGKVMASDVAELDSAQSLLGQYLMVAASADGVSIDESQVILTDIEAANGVIHVIDSVLLPESRSIVDLAVEDGRFSTLVAALQAAGLAETLDGDGAFTVFAPTDDAFAALPAGTVAALLADIPQLTDILLYHVVDGRVMSTDVLGMGMADSLQGQSLDFMFDGNAVQIGDATIIITDIQGSNGVIHVIDAVLIPPAA